MPDDSIEAPAALRAGAAQMFLMFNALQQAGFTEDQALKMLASIMAISYGSND
jgi:hypothetical protein